MAAQNGSVNAAGLANRNYIRWDAEGVEKIPPDEEEDIQASANMLNGVQKFMYNAHRHCFAATHARTQGIVKGKFIVSDDLPAHLKQTELFSHGGEYDVVCRYSTEPSDPGLDDRIPQPRGFAMKIFGIHGDMFDDGKDFPTQDIEFNSTPVLDLADAKTAREIIELRLKHMYPSEEGIKTIYEDLRKRPDFDLQTGRDKVRNTHLESTRQYSQTAIRFGDYVIKYRLEPSSETQRKLYEETIKPEDGSDILSRWLKNFHENHDAEYLFQVQLCENLEDQPVEYAGKVWDPERYPHQTVAKLVIPKQDSFNYERVTFWQDHMRVDQWHGLKSLQPLGSSNRLRRVVYPASSKLRRTINGRKEINVKEINEIP
ncbi:heme-dependent catalase [Rhizodiscina lignyota]|uniref:Heme-dependent catalase n=1 Tax=Rhizodiscina lignyota TaxID=1504668 RepID=A0A9P4M7F2_9PEZI|nr:heme-dependent catalase [Rhizodiscina lignyota]